MHRHVKHVVAVVEDFLHALSVVHVRIEHRHFAEAATQDLCRDGCVIDIAKASGRITARVVSRGTAQRIGLRLSIEQFCRAGYRALRRPVGREPRVLANRATAIGEVMCRLGKNAAHGIGLPHEHVGHDLVAPVQGDFLPACVCGLQELQVAGIVHGEQWLHPVIGRGQHRHPQDVQPGKDTVDSLRNFLGRAHLPA